MSHSRHTMLAVLAGIVFPGLTCLGQTNLLPSLPPSIAPGTTPTITSVDREGRVVISDKQADDLGLAPTIAERQKLPEAIKERLQRFEVNREAYLREQEQLKKRLLGASTEAERERIRDSMREQREAWLRRAKVMREEAKERVRELRTQLPSMKEVIENARENARDNVIQIRKRRGEE